MARLHEHEAGNGGHGQGKPVHHRAGPRPYHARSPIRTWLRGALGKARRPSSSLPSRQRPLGSIGFPRGTIFAGRRRRRSIRKCRRLHSRRVRRRHRSHLRRPSTHRPVPRTCRRRRRTADRRRPACRRGPPHKNTGSSCCRRNALPGATRMRRCRAPHPPAHRVRHQIAHRTAVRCCRATTTSCSRASR
jgi:hypothetical protein